LTHGSQLVKQTLNNNKLNVALGPTHLQYNAQHEKKIGSFYYIRIMINVVNMFFKQKFKEKNVM